MQYGALSDSDVLYREAYVFLKKINTCATIK